MNERIRELAKQLGPDPVGYIGNWGRVEWADNVYPQLGDQMYAAIDLEKFAELIVKEMLQTCKDHPAWTGRMIGEQIKQDFGVKE
jgi:hypothetical protein